MRYSKGNLLDWNRIFASIKSAIRLTLVTPPVGRRVTQTSELAMPQSNLLELAKHGEPDAIAALINAVLVPKGIIARTSLEDDYLLIFLEAPKPLNQTALVQFIQKGLRQLDSDSIQQVKVHSQTFSDDSRSWTETFVLHPERLSAPQEAEPDIAPFEVASSDLANPLEHSNGDLTKKTETADREEIAEPANFKTISEAADRQEIAEPVELKEISEAADRDDSATEIKASETSSDRATDKSDDEADSLTIAGWIQKRWKRYVLPVTLVVVGGFIAGGSLAFWSTRSQNQSSAPASPDETVNYKQQEAEAYLKRMNQAQEKFYQQNKRFAGSLEELERSANVIARSYSYAYRLRVGKTSMIMAVPRETGLKSYVGSVFPTGSKTESVICQSLKPSMQAPTKAEFSASKKQAACGARSVKLP